MTVATLERTYVAESTDPILASEPNEYLSLQADATEQDEQQFLELARIAEQDTLFASTADQRSSSEAYRRILGMGVRAIAPMLHALEREPADWFAALYDITGVNPATIEDAGNIQAMTAAWLRWGHEAGYI